MTINNAGISIIMGLYMLFLQKRTIKRGVAYWAAGSLVVGMGVLCRLFTVASGSHGMIGFTLLVTAGLYLYLAGIWVFCKKPVNWGILIGLPSFCLIQSVVTLKVFYFPRLQIFLYYLGMAVFCVLAIIQLWNTGKKEAYLRKIFKINAGVLMLFICMLAWDFVELILDPGMRLVSSENEVLLVFVMCGFLMIAVSFGFLTAVNLQLDREVKSQLESKNKFFSIIAHDLRGPVGNIMTFLNVLTKEQDLNEHDQKKYLEITNSLSCSTFQLLQNLLAWATNSKDINKFKRENIDLKGLVDENLAFFESSAAVKSIHFSYHSSNESTCIYGNSDMLLTVIRNLFSNALKFTPNGGCIDVCAKKVQDKVQLVVADSGTGMPQETVDALLQTKQVVSKKGTDGEVGSGLGFVLCKDFVHQNKGKLFVTSELNKGTKVVIEFPSVN